jgi:hypothetical protein
MKMAMNSMFASMRSWAGSELTAHTQVVRGVGWREGKDPALLVDSSFCALFLIFQQQTDPNMRGQGG